MLSIFPIHFLSLFAFFILRITVGAILIYLGVLHAWHFRSLRNVMTFRWWPFGTVSVLLLILTELIAGIFILVGAYTQLATLIVALLCFEFLIIKTWWQHESLPPRMVYILLGAACLSLTITGAGVFAFDLPL